MKDFDFKRLLPHAIAIVIFLVLSSIYFMPELEGKKLDQSDIRQFKGMSKELADYREETGEEALWTNAMFGGMPAYQVSTVYPNPVLKPVDRVLRAFSRGGLGKVFLYMLSFYLLCMALRLNPWLGVMGAIAFGLSSYHLIILEAGHTSKALAIGYLPGVVAGFLLLFREKSYLLGTIVTALFLGLQLMSNHPQITYYMLIMLVITGIAYLIDAIRRGEYGHLTKAFGLFVLASGLAIGTSASRLMTTLEYSPSTIRGPSELTSNEGDRTDGLDKAYATAWSYGIGETFTLLVPNFNGGGTALMGNDQDALKEVSRANRQIVSQSVNRYWGDQTFTSGPVYLGALVVLLALLGIWYVEGPLKWGLVVSAILTIALSWGKNYMPLTEWFLDNFPMYNKFRAVSMILVVAEFIFPLLAVLGVHQIIQQREEIKKKPTPFYAITGGLALLLVLMLVTPTSFTTFFSNTSQMPGTDEIGFYEAQLASSGADAARIDSILDDIEIARRSLFSADVMRSLILVLLGGGLLFLFIRGVLKPTWVIISLALITLGDLWTVDHRYLNEENFVKAQKMEKPFQPTAADQQILQDKGHFRVYNTTRALDKDASVSYFHNSLGGYHGAKLRRYQEVIERHLSRNNRQVLNMLNTKYIIGPDQQGNLRAQLNDQALGNVWFVDEIDVVESADAEIAALDAFEPGLEAVIDQRFGIDASSIPTTRDEAATISLTSVDAKLMEYESNSSTDQFAVFSEIYYQPGWNAYVDNEPVDHVRVDYILRGLNVPAGQHSIDFRFEPSSFSTGNTIVYICSVLLLLLVGYGVYSTLRNRRAA